MIAKIVKRLDSQAVAGSKEFARSSVPNDECEHSPEMLNTIASVLFVQMDDGFGVAAGAILGAARDQIATQFLVVIDFAVVNNPNISVFIADRLVPALHVNDAEPAHR